MTVSASECVAEGYDFSTRISHNTIQSLVEAIYRAGNFTYFTIDQDQVNNIKHQVKHQVTTIKHNENREQWYTTVNNDYSWYTDLDLGNPLNIRTRYNPTAVYNLYRRRH